MHTQTKLKPTVHERQPTEHQTLFFIKMTTAVGSQHTWTHLSQCFLGIKRTNVGCADVGAFS